MTLATENNDPTTAADDSTVTDAYDSLGRVIEETQRIGDQPALATDSAWRADDLRSSLTYPDGRVEVYTYDASSRLKTVSDQGAAQPIAAYEYIGPDRVLERNDPINGTSETFLDNSGTVNVGYDGLGRPIEERDLEADGSLMVGFTYTYDRMGNKLTEGKLHDPANSETYTYDSADRLIGFRRAAGGLAPLQGSWTLDGVGNWTSVDSQTRQFSSNNEVIEQQSGGSTTSLGYDSNGNETDDGTYLYSYDAFNRLRTVTRKSDGAPVATYSYDADNRRTSKVVTDSGGSDGTTDFYYDGWQDIEDRDGNGALVQQYVVGALDEVLVMDRNLGGGGTATGPGDQRLFYYQDAQGSTFALADAQGRIVEAYQYDAYGATTVFGPGPDGVVNFGQGAVVLNSGVSALGNPYTFTGQRMDPESGLMYDRNRYFSTTLGRFTSRDPIGLAGGSLNLYEYVSSDPTGYVNPSGLDGEDPTGETADQGSGDGSSQGSGDGSYQGFGSGKHPLGYIIDVIHWLDSSPPPKSVVKSGSTAGRVAATAEAVTENVIYAAKPTTRGNIVHAIVENMPHNNPGFDILNASNKTITQVKTISKSTSTASMRAAAQKGARDIVRKSGPAFEEYKMELLISMQTGEGSERIAAAESALANSRVPGVENVEVTVQTGLPGAARLLKVLTVVGFVASTNEFMDNLKHDQRMEAFGSGTAAISSGLEIVGYAGEYVAGGITWASPVGAVIGAISLGWTAGTLIDRYIVAPIFWKKLH